MYSKHCKIISYYFNISTWRLYLIFCFSRVFLQIYMKGKQYQTRFMYIRLYTTLYIGSWNHSSEWHILYKHKGCMSYESLWMNQIFITLQQNIVYSTFNYSVALKLILFIYLYVSTIHSLLYTMILESKDGPLIYYIIFTTLLHTCPLSFIISIESK